MDFSIEGLDHPSTKSNLSIWKLKMLLVGTINVLVSRWVGAVLMLVYSVSCSFAAQGALFSRWFARSEIPRVFLQSAVKNNEKKKINLQHT